MCDCFYVAVMMSRIISSIICAGHIVLKRLDETLIFFFFFYFRTDFIITASQDGHVKFWKKKEDQGIEFVKHFRSHLGMH